MSTSEHIRELESELEASRRDLRADASHISDKIDDTKAQLSPTNFVRDRIMLVLGVAVLVGFGAGYLLGRRPELATEVVAPSAIEHLGKPIARRMLMTAGREAATRAIRGR
jgi:hypothetical protein